MATRQTDGADVIPITRARTLRAATEEATAPIAGALAAHSERCRVAREGDEVVIYVRDAAGDEWRLGWTPTSAMKIGAALIRVAQAGHGDDGDGAA